jgi:hypothetical protein
MEYPYVDRYITPTGMREKLIIDIMVNQLIKVHLFRHPNPNSKLGPRIS